MNEELERILREMCTYVGANFDAIDWSSRAKDYWREWSWSRAAELCFTGWLEQELQKRSVRDAIMGKHCRNTKAMRKACAEQFVLWHGWMKESE